MTQFQFYEILVIVSMLVIIGLPAAIGSALPVRPRGDYRRVLAWACFAIVLAAAGYLIERNRGYGVSSISAGLWSAGLSMSGVFAASMACATGIRQAVHFRSWGALAWLVVAGALPAIAVPMAYNYAIVLISVVTPRDSAQILWAMRLPFVLAMFAPLGTVAYALWGTLVARRHPATGAAAA
jgi:hypothetical protein